MATSEERFSTQFEGLLRLALLDVADELFRGYYEWDDLELPVFQTVNRLRNRPEGANCFAIASSTQSLVQITWTVGREPSTDPSSWIGDLLRSALHRYFRLSPQSADQATVTLHARRLRRVVREVVEWAKADPTPVVSTWLLKPMLFPRPVRFRVDDRTIIRGLNAQEASVFNSRFDRAIPLQAGLPCLVTNENLPRMESKTRPPPAEFLKVLQLVLNRNVTLGEGYVRPAIPSFGNSNVGRISGNVEFYGALVGHRVVASELRTARKITLSFSDLAESGFDLALDLYEGHLRRKSDRERAVDVAIALENLYLSGVTAELSHRFQLNVLAFSNRLGKTFRVDAATAKGLYSARSKVVHGTKPPTEIIHLLNSEGAKLVRGTLLTIASERNRRFLTEVDAKVLTIVGGT